MQAALRTLSSPDDVFARAAAAAQTMTMPGFSLGIADLRRGTHVFYNVGTWSGAGSPAVDDNTVYDLASISKLYTAALVLDLHQTGRLNIDDSCAAYLDVFAGSHVTVHDLLTHKAHFDTGFGGIRQRHGDDIANAIFNITPPAQASANRDYQNATYTYLGRMVEVVTGQSLANNFDAFFARHGLLNTHCGRVGQTHFTAPPTERFADGSRVQNVTHDETARLLGGVAGHAGVFASNADLLKFGMLWLDGTLIRDQSLFVRVFQNYSADDFYAQGLGWQNRPSFVVDYNPALFHQPGFTGGTLAVNIATQTVCSFVCNRSFAGRDNADHKTLRRVLFAFLDGR